MKSRKLPFQTHIPFTVARLQEEVERVKALGLVDQQYNCANEPGFEARISSTGRISLYSRYSFQCRSYRYWLGELGLISLAQARQQHRDNRAKAARGENPRQPVKEPMVYRELHEEHYRMQCRSRGKKSIHTDESRHRNWLGPAFNDMPVKTISKTDVARLIVRMQEAGRAPASIKTTLAQLRTTLELAVELGEIERNPTKGVRTPRVDNRRTEFMTVTQVKAFMAAAQADDDIVGSRMLMLMALTAARLGETTAAKWADIWLGEGIWELPTQKSGRRGRIYLCQAAQQVIRDLEPYRCNDFLFPGAKGNAQRSRPIKLFHRLCERAAIPKGFRIHDLRHAWCSLGNLAEIPLEIISLAARHSSPVVTRVYSHAHRESLVAANEKIAALIMPPIAA